MSDDVDPFGVGLLVGVAVMAVALLLGGGA